MLKELPDILILQEVNKAWVAKIEEIENVLPYKFIRSREDNFGIAVYSQYPFDSSEVIYPGTSDIPSIKAVFSIEQKKISLITSHPLPPVTNNHYKSRNSQLEARSQISKEVETPLILIGDLNLTMWSSNYKILEEYSTLLNTRKGYGILPTWPANNPLFMIPIDHCLVSSEFVVLDMLVAENIGSDHLPIIVTLGF